MSPIWVQRVYAARLDLSRTANAMLSGARQRTALTSRPLELKLAGTWGQACVIALFMHICRPDPISLSDKSADGKNAIACAPTTFAFSDPSVSN